MVDSIGEQELEADAALGGVGIHQLDGLLRQGDQVGGLEVVLLAALLDAREVQDVLDQGREAAAFLDDEAEVFALLGGLGNFAPFEALGHQADRGDGGAQLVGDAGDEVALQLVQAQLAPEGEPGGNHADQRRERRGGYQRGQQHGVLPVRGEQQPLVGHVKLQDEARTARQHLPVNQWLTRRLKQFAGGGQPAVGLGEHQRRGIGAPARRPAFRQR